jgi:ABC-type Fe3+-siderophore transport system permease subunit
MSGRPWLTGGAWAVNAARAAAIEAARDRPDHPPRSEQRRPADDPLRTAQRRARRDPMRVALAIIAVLTVLTGATQIVAPGPVLALLGADSTATTRYLFAIVGMFMVVVGAVTANALRTRHAPAYVIGWAAAQKLGAAVAVALAVAQGLFAPLALAVAAFDLLTAVLAGALWLRSVDARRPMEKVV